MKQLDFEGSGPRSSLCVEPTEGVMVLDCCCQAAVHNPRHYLPDYFNHINAAEVSASLMYQDNGLPGTLFRELTLVEGGLDHPGDLLPVGGVC